MPKLGTQYFDSAFNKREKVIKQAVKLLSPRLDEFDVIACRGYSGMIVAPTIAYLLKTEIFIVRKSGEATHSAKSCMGSLGYRYLVIDDFIQTGETIRQITQELDIEHKRFDMKPGEIIGIYLYEKLEMNSGKSWHGIPYWHKI